MLISWETVAIDCGWAPPIEIFEKEDKSIVKAESEVKEEDYYCCERCYGSFFRSITLPTTMDTESIEATYEDGVLEISLLKAPEVKPKKIELSVK